MEREAPGELAVEIAAVQCLHDADADDGGTTPVSAKGFDASPHEALVHNQRRFLRFHDLLHFQVLEWQLRSQLMCGQQSQPLANRVDRPPNALTLEV